LRQTLVDSFTGEQLAVYYRQGKRDKTEASPAASEIPSYSWLVKQRSWKPADRDKPDASSSSTKSRLARMIMQTQWGRRIPPARSVSTVRPYVQIQASMTEYQADNLPRTADRSPRYPRSRRARRDDRRGHNTEPSKSLS
jgi:hypothetical protein